MQQCNKNVENGVKNIPVVSQSVTSSFDAQALSAFGALICTVLESLL